MSSSAGTWASAEENALVEMASSFAASTAMRMADVPTSSTGGRLNARM